MSTDIGCLKNSYEAKEPALARFCARLAEQLNEIIRVHDVPLAVPIEARVKSWTSLTDKITRRKLVVADVSDVNDLIGLRIILLFKRDLERVTKLISSSLKLISTEDAIDRLGVQMFGYQSVHLQVELPEAWSKVPTLKDFSGFKAEIQLRTAAQHKAVTIF